MTESEKENLGGTTPRPNPRLSEIQNKIEDDYINSTNAHHLQHYLKLPFPATEMQVDSSRGFPLCSIKAQKVINRLNDVFGYNGWSFHPVCNDKEKGVLCRGSLFVKHKEQPVIHYGYADFNVKDGKLKKNAIGDAYKSATTDCLSKCASIIGIGNDVYSGDVCPYFVGASKKSEQFLLGYNEAKKAFPGTFLGVTIKKAEEKWNKKYDWWSPSDMKNLLKFWEKKSNG